MQVKWNEFLKALGAPVIGDSPESRQCCPLHSGTAPTLDLRKSHVTDGWQFVCADSKCGFCGDAVALVSRTKGISTSAAIDLFRKDKPLSHTLLNDMGEYQLDAYLEDHSSQVRVASYLNAASQAIRHPENADIRRKLSDLGASQDGESGLSSLPKSLAVVIQGDVPPVFREFATCKAYRRGSFVLYPHTFDGAVTHVTVQDVSGSNLRTRTVSVTRDDIGVFMEDNIKPGQDSVFVTTSELVACILYKKFRAASSSLPPIVATRNFPLPPSLSSLRRITILSLPDEPLTLESALRFYTVDPVDGVNDDIKLKVWDVIATKAADTPPNMFTRNYDNPHQKGQRSLGCWIANAIKTMVTSENEEAVYWAFDRVKVDDSHKETIISELVKLGETEHACDVVILAGSEYRSSFRLGNGREVRITPSGLVAVGTNGNTAVLSNVPIVVDNCVCTRGGEVRYTCKFRTADNTSVSVRLSKTDFVSAKKLQSSITDELARQGDSAYVAFYELAGYRWSDILTRMAEGKPVQREILRLGADEYGNVHFPLAMLDLTGMSVNKQSRVYTLPKEVRELYAGVGCVSDVDAVSSVKAFVENAPAYPWSQGILAGFCHLVYQLLADVISVRGGTTSVPRHLFFVSEESTTWTPVLQQLAQLFSGCNQLGQIPSVQSGKYLESVSSLGPLPCVKLMPCIPYKRIPNLISDSPTSLMSLADNDVAMVLTGDTRVSFVVPPSADETVGAYIQPEDICALQRALPEFLAALLSEPTTYAQEVELRNSVVPAKSAYIQMCGFLGIPARKDALKLVNQYYTVAGVSNAYAFLHALAELIEVQSHRLSLKLRIKHGLPGESDTATFFVNDDIVVIDRVVVSLVNKYTYRLGLFNSASLTAELDRMGYLKTCEGSHIDRGRFWVLDRVIWDKYVMREPLVLVKRVENGNLIHLPRLIA